MIIKNIYISAFGGLENFSLDLSDGFNTIYGQNENGKSTIMAFIKMMFYGSQRGAKLKNLRTKYTPWSNKQMAGSITFCHAGRNYRIEREFKSSNSTDKVTLFDLDLGTKEICPADIGTRFFALSESAFERSIYISNLANSKESSDADGEINAKLSNLNSSGEEDISYTEIVKRLEKAKNEISSKRATAGIMDKNIIKLRSLEEKYSAECRSQSHIKSLKNTLQALSIEIQNAKKSLNDINKKIDAFQKHKNKKKIAEMLDIKKSLDEHNHSLALSDGKFIDDIFVRSLVFSIGKIENLDEKIEAKLNEEALLKSNIELLENPREDITEEAAQKIAQEINSISREYEDLKQKGVALFHKKKELENEPYKTKTKRTYPFLLIPAIFSLFGGILTLLKNLYLVSIPLFLVALILLIVSLKLKNPKRKSQDKELTDLEKLIADNKAIYEKKASQIEILHEKLNSIKTVLSSNSTLIENQKAALLQTNEQILELSSLKENECHALIEFFGRYKSVDSIDEIKDSLEDLSCLANEQKELKQQLNFYLKDLNNISYDEAREIVLDNESQDATPENIEQLEEEQSHLLSFISEKSNAFSAVETEIKILEKVAVNPDILLSEITLLKEEINNEKAFCDYIKIAIQTLNESFAELRSNYGSVLEKKATAIFTGLTNGEYTDMIISKDFDINVEKNNIFGQKEIDYLSSGTADQAYLSLRLALSTLIESNEPLPLFLDDSLMQYDDSRTLSATNYLKEFSKNNQIIMFTCHGFIAESAKKSGSIVQNM